MEPEKLDRPAAARDEALEDRLYYDRLAPEYFHRHQQPIQRYTTQVEARWLRSWVPRGSRVLLVGSGGGRELGPLLELGCDVVALDYSQKMLEVGRRRWGERGVRWVLGDVHDLREHAGSFEALVCLAALNYFRDLRRALSNMAGALVPGGRMVLSSLNRLHRTERRARSASGIHRQPYAPGELERLVEEAGLRVLAVRGLRVVADLLPPSWNRPRAPLLGRAALELALLGERFLRPFAAPQRGKFFWIVAER